MSLPETTKFSVLLHHNGNIAKLIIEEIHRLSMHMGMQTVLAESRRKWWITKARTTIKKYLRKCIICKKYQGPPYARFQMPALPSFKGQKCKPFEITGLDYFGLVALKADDVINTTIKK